METYNYSYGSFTRNQIADTKAKMRKQIFFLLLIVDPKTADKYDTVDVNAAFESMLVTFGGLNGLLNYPQEFVEVMALIYAAYLEYKKHIEFGKDETAPEENMYIETVDLESDEFMESELEYLEKLIERK